MNETDCQTADVSGGRGDRLSVCRQMMPELAQLRQRQRCTEAPGRTLAGMQGTPLRGYLKEAACRTQDKGCPIEGPAEQMPGDWANVRLTGAAVSGSSDVGVEAGKEMKVEACVE